MFLYPQIKREEYISLQLCFKCYKSLNVTRAPPPLAFAGISGDGNSNTFLKIFEKYAHSIYKKDTGSWVQVLPPSWREKLAALLERMDEK